MDVLYQARIALELRVVGADVALCGEDLRLQQVCFVQKQNDRDAGERGVVDDRVEYILRLLQPVGCAVQARQEDIEQQVVRNRKRTLRNGMCALFAQNVC